MCVVVLPPGGGGGGGHPVPLPPPRVALRILVLTSSAPDPSGHLVVAEVAGVDLVAGMVAASPLHLPWNVDPGRDLKRLRSNALPIELQAGIRTRIFSLKVK
jgi:hypothetical protein